MAIIIKTLKEIKYIKRIVLTIAKTNKEEFAKAKKILAPLVETVKIIWNDGDNIQNLYKLLKANDLDAGTDGNGRSTWMAYGYILAEGKIDVIALNDCDIVTYNREFLARLCYPVVNPNLDYEFCKGYYSRVTDRLYGRVNRLLITRLSGQ